MNLTNMIRQNALFLAFLIPALASAPSLAEEPEDTSCNSTAPLSAHPNRPTETSPATITPCGFIEHEYGFSRQWAPGDLKVNRLSGLVRYGIGPHFEFRWNRDDLVQNTTSKDTQRGVGDFWLGGKTPLLKQNKIRPDMALGYAVKAPVASTEKGIGSGKVDHQVDLLFSKDVKKVHFDYSTYLYFVGRPTRSGYDENQEMALAAYFPVYHALSFVTEGYGFTELNRDTPASISFLEGFAYAVRPRLVLDVAMDEGLKHGSPRKRLQFGFTYTIAAIPPGKARLR